MVTLIGDIHGQVEKYYEIVKNCEYSIQLGDFGFSRDYEILRKLSPEKHHVLLGNHESYNLIANYPHFLGDFGVIELGSFRAFYVRGGRSIDQKYRTPGLDYFPEEEIPSFMYKTLIDCYRQEKPSIVLSHECPDSVCNKMFGQKTYDGELIKPSQTSLLLDELFEIHRPQHWFFGHHHQTKTRLYNTTWFYCLGELQIIDVAC